MTRKEKDKDIEQTSGVGPWSRLWRDHRLVSGSSWHKMPPYWSVGLFISKILSSLTILHNAALLKPIYFPGWDWPKPSDQQPRYSCWGDLDFITNIVSDYGKGSMALFYQELPLQPSWILAHPLVVGAAPIQLQPTILNILHYLAHFALAYLYTCSSTCCRCCIRQSPAHKT